MFIVNEKLFDDIHATHGPFKSYDDAIDACIAIQDYNVTNNLFAHQQRLFTIVTLDQSWVK